jgi:hypothetical protein
MMLAGKGIIKRGISQVLRESGDDVKVLRAPRAIATIVRQISRDAMIFPSSGISFPSGVIQFALRRSQGGAASHIEITQSLYLASGSERVVRLWQTLSASSDEWHASCVIANSNHVPLGHCYSARVKQAVTAAQNYLLTRA